MSENNDNKAGGEAPEGQNPQTVPLADFLEVKKILKEQKEKLAQFEDKDKKGAEAKLLEEKKYQELITQKDKEIEDFKTKFSQQETGFKREQLKNKLTREFEKNNAINPDDALKFVDFDKLLGSDQQDSDIKTFLDDLVKNKSYLFKPANQNRGKNENNAPSGDSSSANQNKQAKGRLDLTDFFNKN